MRTSGSVMDGPDAKAHANRMLTQHGTSACDRVAVRMSRMVRGGPLVGPL